MLTNLFSKPWPPPLAPRWRPSLRALLVVSALVAGSAPALPTSTQPARAGLAPAQPGQPAPAQSPPSPVDEDFGNDPPPPPDLVVLAKKSTLKGRWRLGVYGRQQDPSQPQVWRLKIWEQTEDRVFVSTDVLACSPRQPMRITGGSGGGQGVLILRELNPGGPITPGNQLDHQIWWAACFPERAGGDPATLGLEARRLGYSGLLREREQVVPGARRP
ncbi:MAG: hypothetical protein ACK6AD_09545 [Cyanobacteriota bacterium]